MTPLSRNAARIVLVVIVVGAACQALRWALCVPIFQAPDEPAHLDYALSICERRGLFRPEEVPAVPYRHGWMYCGHPHTRYLLDRSETATLAFNPGCKVALGYGSAAYFEALDRDAPRPAGEPRPPILAMAYPWGYYGLLALWLGTLRCFTDSLVVAFFGARIFSVALLLASLVLVHRTARALRLRRSLALALTATLGFFPLTSFVSSYVQPDNLSFAMVGLCYYLALRARAAPLQGWRCTALGVALAALLMTKAHHFACVFVPVAGMLASRLLVASAGKRDWFRLFVRLTLPSALAVAATFRWTAWGATFLQEELSARPPATAAEVLDRLRRAVLDFYAGVTHESFWGRFGWMDTPLVIVTPRTTELIQSLIQAVAWVLVALTIVRLAQVAVRLGRLSCRRRGRLALSLATSNPVLNSYFLFTALMVWLYIRSDNFFAAQGRNWLPFLLPAFLTGLVYAPRAIPLPRIRNAFAAGLVGGLMAFVVLGTHYGLRTVRERYYVDPAPTDVREVMPRPTPGLYAHGPHTILSLPNPEFVYAVRLKLHVEATTEGPLFCQVVWKRAASAMSGMEQSTFFHVMPDERGRLLTVWVQGTMDEMQVRPLDGIGRLAVSDVTLLQKPCASDWTIP